MNRLRRRGLLWGALCLAGLVRAQPVPEVGVGRIERLPALASRHVEARAVDVWLPPGYSPARRYAVLYMHDGQLLFDAAKSWNGQAWNVHQALAALIGAGTVQDTLIVGIWNTGAHRHGDYFPDRALPTVAEPWRTDFTTRLLAGGARADAYLRYLVEELKPAIDARYATRPGRDSTFIMGSSMGGLISLYALCEYPQVFGGAAALSTHWTGSFEANAAIPLALLNYLSTHLPDPASHRLYLDRGTVGLDALYAPTQPLVDQLLRDHGFAAPRFVSRVFEGADHTERDWAARVSIPLTHLLQP